MRPEENHKFLVIETPWSVLFLNYVTSSFACPKKNKKQKSALDTEGFNESRSEVTRKLYRAATWNLQVFYPKLARDLWRMVVIFKFNKNTSIKCNRNLTLLYKFQQKSTTPITSALQTNKGSHKAMSNSHLPKLSDISKKISLILHT